MSQSDKDSKKEKLRTAVKERVDKEEHAFRLVEKIVLLASVDKEFLLNAGAYITVSQYNDVTEERAITKLCGYPLCSNRITQVLKQKYKISVREKKVYDITERKNFCSNKCYKASKYFQSQLSSEAIWMRGKTTSLELKLFDDDEDLATKLSGCGEEILINIERNDDKQEHVEDEHEHVGDEHEHIDFKHEPVDDEHENVDNDHEHVDDEHEDDNTYKHIDNNEDLGCIIERTGNVQIDLGIDLTDSDDDDEDDDDIDYGHHKDKIDNNKESLVAKNSENSGHDNFKSARVKRSLSNNQEETTKDLNSNKDSSLSVGQSENRITNLNKKVNPNCHSHTNSGLQYTDKLKLSIDTKYETTSSSKKEVYTSETTKTTSDKEYKRSEVHNVSSDGSAVRCLGDANGNEKEQARKQSVDKVYHVLLEWCSVKTRECIRSSLQNKENELLDQRGRFIAKEKNSKRKDNAKSELSLPSIDSRSQIAIRGKIVSEKVMKSMTPMLSKVGLIMADISYQLTCILKTFRFTSTNIVLKPAEWTLVALILLLVLVKYSSSLTGLLSLRQKDLHSLLSNTVDDEGDVDRLLGVFNFDEVSLTKPAEEDGQHHFDMEELD